MQPGPIPIVVPSGSPLPITGVLATEVVLSGVIGPSSASGFVTTTVACPDGSVALSGGVKTTPPPDSGQPSPLHLDGSFPSDAGGHPVADGASAGDWTAIVEEGADVNGPTSNTTTFVFAVCGAGTLSTLVRAAATPGPFGGSGIVTVTASCPAGTLLVGGGANTVPGNEGIAGAQPSPLHLVASAPSSAASTIVTSSGPSPGSWAAVAEEGADTSWPGPPAIDTATSAYAVCAAGSAVQHVAIVAVSSPGPTTSSGYVTATATCPAGTLLVGGGSFVNAPRARASPPRCTSTATTRAMAEAPRPARPARTIRGASYPRPARASRGRRPACTRSARTERPRGRQDRRARQACHLVVGPLAFCARDAVVFGPP